MVSLCISLALGVGVAIKKNGCGSALGMPMISGVVENWAWSKMAEGSEIGFAQRHGKA